MLPMKCVAGPAWKGEKASMELLKRLRRRVFLARLPGILAVLLPALVLGAVLAPALGQLVQGPQDLYSLDPAALEGRYAAANIDTIWDWYADTVVTGKNGQSRTVAREYLVPLGDGRSFIGVEVPAEQIAAGDRVLEQTALWRSSPETYLWDGSQLTVRGTLCPMDEETRRLYYGRLRDYYGLSEAELEPFLPLVLKQGQVGGLEEPVFVLLGVVELCLLAAAVLQAAAAWKAAKNLPIARYCRTRSFPEEDWDALERMCGLTGSTSGLSLEDGWLVCLDGARSWALEAGDVAWVYPFGAGRRHNGSRWRVLVYSRSEPPALRRHEIPANSEEDAREIIRDLMPHLPGTVFGYSYDREREYCRDPAGFGRCPDPAGTASQPPLL